MADSPTYRTKAFISYSHADKPYLQRLQAHLKPFVRESNIQVWDDTQIKPGTDWRERIERGLAEAQVVILLVSVGFLASDFIAEKELPQLILLLRLILISSSLRLRMVRYSLLTSTARHPASR